MSSQLYLKIFVVISLLISFAQPLGTAVPSRSNLVSVYLFRLAENIQWANQANIKTYRIHIIDDSRSIYDSLKGVAKIKKLHGKPIKVTRSTRSDVPADAHLIYLSADKAGDYPRIFKEAQGRNVLLVSDSVANKRIIMINLFETEEKGVRFEINKANILNQNLGINPDIILLGGTEIDVAELYRKAQLSLNEQDERINALQRERMELEEKMKEIRQERGALKEAVDIEKAALQEAVKKTKEQEAIIEEGHKEYDLLMRKNEQQQDIINDQKALVESEHRKYEELTERIRTREEALSKQEKEIEARSTILEEQGEKIERQEKTIDEQEEVLARQTDTISMQQNFLYALMAVVLLIAGLAITIFQSYRMRTRTNALLIESERKLKEAQHIASLGQWELNLKTDKLDWSDEAYRIFEIDEKTFDNSYEAFIDVVHPEDRHMVSRAYTSSVERKKPYELVHRLLMKDDRIKFVRELGRTEYAEDGSPSRSIGSVQDITPLKMVEEELKAAKEEADLANRAKSIFLANMSHELRTPLNAILGFSQMMARDAAVTEKQREQVGIINRSGEHLLAMINDILDLSKIEAGKTELEMRPFNVESLLDDVSDMIRPKVMEKSVTFSLEKDSLRERFVKGDAGKIRQVLINLLANAIKFTDRGGVTLRAKTEPLIDRPSFCRLSLEVEDTGYGIEEEMLGRIFEPFIQAGERRGNVKGTGLGLAISNSFIKNMGGEVSVESKKGQGSLFKVGLPLEKAHVEEPAVTIVPAGNVTGLVPGQASYRILVVEDDPENLLLLTTLLKDVGFSIREAVNGKEALEIFRQWHPHFIWMDMRMPVMDGYEATSKIRDMAGGHEVKIAAITASAFKEQRGKILNAGCDEILWKPFQPEEIFHMMEKLLAVKYLYEEEGQVPALSHKELTPEILSALPLDQLESLHKAAKDFDDEAMEKLIIELKKLMPEAANGLGSLLSAFRFDIMIDLCNEAIKLKKKVQ